MLIYFIILVIILKKIIKIIIKIIKSNYSPYQLIKKKSIQICKINDLTRIALILPTTSKKRNYINYQDCDFISILLHSFLVTYDKYNNFEYTFYLGYDHDDIFYLENKDNIINYFKNLKIKNLTIQMIKINLKERGHLSEIWNILFKKAIKDNNDYIYQLGDDIRFLDKNWEINFISKLKENNNIGVIGPMDLNNDKILTQSFVHKTHYNIFQYYFPKIIKNLYIDNWIENVYKKNIFCLFSLKQNKSFKIKDIRIINSGGSQRYNNLSESEMVKSYNLAMKEGKIMLNKYLKSKKQ
jgi:hypothetical protein